MKLPNSEVFSDLDDVRRNQGKKHGLALCLALFTLAVAAGKVGFIWPLEIGLIPIVLN